ncbi:MAG: hypothetical protein SGARI_007383, partial [Bacillariaceae sp.]
MKFSATALAFASLVATAASKEEQEQNLRGLGGNSHGGSNEGKPEKWYRFGCNQPLEARLFDPGETLRSDAKDVPDTAVNGVVKFSCSDDWEWNGQLTKIEYRIEGLSDGLHGLHVHEYMIGGADGMDPEDCASTGGHWNPEGTDHGTNLDFQRHIGDMANIESINFDSEGGVAEGTLQAFIPLQSWLGIRGTAVVVHGGEDDLGLGGNNGSRANGNAGPRVGCGDI